MCPERMRKLCRSVIQKQREITDEIQTYEVNGEIFYHWGGGGCPAIARFHKDVTLHRPCKMHEAVRVQVVGK